MIIIFSLKAIFLPSNRAHARTEATVYGADQRFCVGSGLSEIAPAKFGHYVTVADDADHLPLKLGQISSIRK